jgi:ornithine cyclodeaminase/alanine dehydrogenase-like protein (mu-crystallin family)
MSETLLLTRRDVAELLPMADCIDALERAFRAQATGGTLPSQVLGVLTPEGGLHVKAAGLRRSGLYIAAKLNANFPRNLERTGLPTIQGLVVLFDGDDGRPLAVMDSIEITALRTAAATALAARHLARLDARSVALVGCGVQALYQIRALAVVRPIGRVVAHDTEQGKAERLADRVTRELDIVATAVDDVRAATIACDIAVTCTPSRSPILGPGDVPEGAFIAGVGADSPDKHELAPALIAGSRVVVDSLEQAAAFGDLHHALRAGAVTREHVAAELWQLAAGLKPGRRSADELTLFDSTGVALEDVAAAALVFERAVAAGRGGRIDVSA